MHKGDLGEFRQDITAVVLSSPPAAAPGGVLPRRLLS